MHINRLLFVFLIFVFSFSFAPLNPLYVANASRPPACKWHWAPIETPNHPGRGIARRIALRSANDVWVAGTNIWHWNGTKWMVSLKGDENGFHDVATFGKNRVYVLNSQVKFWNGKNWRQLGKLPLDVGTPSTFAVVSKRDIWVAVGDRMFHWNGLKWKQIGDALSIPSRVEDIEVVGPNDIWAGGGGLSHWDGTAWTLSIISNIPVREIYRLSAASANDIWAVGNQSHFDGHQNPPIPLVLHWDGANWTDEFDIGFSAVLSLGANDVWFLSSFSLMHWDGSAFTSFPAAPPSSDSYSLFWDVTIDESNQFWLVGNFNGDNAWAQHQNGDTWDNFDLPEPTSVTETTFNAAVALAPKNVWVAGEYGGHLAMLAHWDGANWSFSDLKQQPGILNAIVAVNANDIWAVGETGDLGGGEPVFLHYDGTNWASIPSPTLPEVENSYPHHQVMLSSVAALSQDNVWVVGYIYTSNWETLILHWDGSAWSVSATPIVIGRQNQPASVFAVSSSDVWAFANRWDGAVWSTIAMHWDGTNWGVVPSPNPNAASIIRSVAGSASNDIWATGSTGDSIASALTAHWDGAMWQTFEDSSTFIVNHIVVLQSHALWGIGAQGGDDFVGRWTGTKWRKYWIAKEPEPFIYLSDIVRISPRKMWAVGNKNYYSVLVQGICN